MKIRHSPHHWIAVALVLAILLLTLSEAHGQSSGAAPQGVIAMENSADIYRFWGH